MGFALFLVEKNNNKTIKLKVKLSNVKKQSYNNFFLAFG